MCVYIYIYVDVHMYTSASASPPGAGLWETPRDRRSGGLAHYVLMCVYMYMYAYIHIYIYIYIYTKLHSSCRAPGLALQVQA